MVELLSPVGDFECLKAAVQNGANAVYFGANLFSARAFAQNFDNNELEKAINYAKIRGVKTHLTLNTLIKNDEFEDAFLLAKYAYELGIDAIIVQDLGLAKMLIQRFPDLSIHASTQMTTANLDGVKKLKDIGFKRIVLSRECSLSEIKNICENSNIEIEVFVHGALCICYSGQCLFSSMVGGRSGNRGKCAQPCRLPYLLYSEDCINSKENLKLLDKGYILSPRDLCGLEQLPELISYGVTSFKIEGRMKSPTYVATVTRIYKKYISLAEKYLKNEISEYVIEEKDKLELLQVFNRGNFSSGHLIDAPNKNLIFPEKPNNMGIYVGKVHKYNSSKGLISSKIEETLSIGDSISLEHENSKYTISELMNKNINIKSASKNDIVTFGRMKGDIKLGDKIFKLSDKKLEIDALNSYSKENKKVNLYCNLEIKANQKINVQVGSLENTKVNISFVYDYIPELAKSAPITKASVIKQFEKTLDTCYRFLNLNIELDSDLFIPTSILNELRRQTIMQIETEILKSYKRSSFIDKICPPIIDTKNNVHTKSVLLNILNTSYDYSKMINVDKIYIPLKYFIDDIYKPIINELSKNGKLYVYLPVVIKNRYLNFIKNAIEKTLKNFEICGCVVSDYSLIEFLKQYNMDLIANYTFNTYNTYSYNELKNIGFSQITLSPELDDCDYKVFENVNYELICYGKIPLMTMSYCLLGKSNRCYNKCPHFCMKNKKFFIRDRYNFDFRIIPDNMQTLTTIYNSRNISINKISALSCRYDFLDETIDEINKTIS